MENLDLIILRTLRDWRRSGSHAVLATVVHTWGSSPRPIGSIMALREDGIVVGSVSGGCIEDDLIARYTQPDAPDALPRNGPPRFLKYGVTADEAHRFGLGYHRVRRAADRHASVLDTLEGVGDARRRALLTFFGSPEKVLAASLEELEAVPGLPGKVARRIYDQLNRLGGEADAVRGEEPPAMTDAAGPAASD